MGKEDCQQAHIGADIQDVASRVQVLCRQAHQVRLVGFLAQDAQENVRAEVNLEGAAQVGDAHHQAAVFDIRESNVNQFFECARFLYLPPLYLAGAPFLNGCDQGTRKRHIFYEFFGFLENAHKLTYSSETTRRNFLREDISLS